MSTIVKNGIKTCLACNSRRVFMEKRNERNISSLTDEEILALSKLKEKVKESFHVVKIILFGSKARGDYNRDSDVDLLMLVEEPKTFESRSKLSDINFDVLMQYDVDLSPMLENIEDWDRGVSVTPMFKNSVLREGVELEL
jgi:predicted nucleotidyltransferase